jgi:glycerol-1-phosphate dehydrogenase [NAD(P)+]
MTERLAKALASATDTRVCLIDDGILKDAPSVFREAFPGKKAVVVADTTTFGVAGCAVQDALKAAGLAVAGPFVFDAAGLYAEMTYVDRLTAALQQHECVPVAVGSGTVNDLTKLASHRCGRPWNVIDAPKAE